MTSDYDKIFYFDANKNLYKGSFYWKYLQFQLKKKIQFCYMVWNWQQQWFTSRWENFVLLQLKE